MSDLLKALRRFDALRDGEAGVTPSTVVAWSRSGRLTHATP